MRNQALALFLILYLSHLASAQVKDDCGYELLLKDVSLMEASFKEKTDSCYYTLLGLSQTGKKTNFNNTHKIPVVFHFIVNKEQFSVLGGEDGIRNRIEKQLVSLNDDYNSLNIDSSQIPSAFKPLFANAGIQFGLAHTSPTGLATSGYDIKIIEKQGINYSNGLGSGIGFSDAKYSKADGLDAWDPSVYLNIWVFNPLQNGNATNITGMTLPFNYVLDGGVIPLSEVGITIHYGAIGIKERTVDFYLPGRNKGRTLTHEIGHFFSLRHPWGDDKGLCPNNGGVDDGIDDTPNQSDAVYGCPSFPKYDVCTSNNNGILYCNYMNYTDDNCRVMFSTKQINLINHELSFGGQLYGLTQHTDLLNYPNTEDYQITISPNPASEKLAVSFNILPKNMDGIKIVDVFGRVVISEYVVKGYYLFDLSNFSSGTYFVIMQSENFTFKKMLTIIK